MPKLSSAGAAARESLEAGDYSAAMQLAQGVLRNEPANAEALLVMAELAIETGNRELAGRLLTTARRTSPTDSRVLGFLQEMNRPGRTVKLPGRLLDTARKALQAADWKRATSTARGALTANSELGGAHAVLGQALLGAGNAAEAVPVLVEALRREPQNAELAKILDEAKRRSEAPSPSEQPATPVGNGTESAAGAATPRRLALSPIKPRQPSTRPVGRKICITFGGEVYDGPTALTVMLAPKFGADEVWVYDDNWIVNQRADFYDHNRWLWEHHHKRGFGWYAWKPFILLDAFEKMADGDIVMYIDADTFPIDDFSVLYETCSRDGGIMLFKAGGNVKSRFKQSQWCKRDCFIVMNQDAPEYYEAEAGVARFMLFQKGQWRAHQFLMEWLTYCVNPIATTFDPSVLGQAEVSGFVEHRTEQAIMTNLAHKYGLKLYREACELGNAFPEDKELYPQLFSQLNPWGNKTAPCVGSKFRNVP